VDNERGLIGLCAALVAASSGSNGHDAAAIAVPQQQALRARGELLGVRRGAEQGDAGGIEERMRERATRFGVLS
jgi:hypothetical protein